MIVFLTIFDNFVFCWAFDWCCHGRSVGCGPSQKLVGRQPRGPEQSYDYTICSCNWYRMWLYRCLWIWLQDFGQRWVFHGFAKLLHDLLIFAVGFGMFEQFWLWVLNFSPCVEGLCWCYFQIEITRCYHHRKLFLISCLAMYTALDTHWIFFPVGVVLFRRLYSHFFGL